MSHPTFHRRGALFLGAACLAAAAGSGLAVAQAAAPRKLAVVILRGAMDGLAAVAPYADANYRALRPRLGLPAPGQEGGVFPLSDGFGLHPSLAFLHESWGAGELAVLHACATPYRERSHFDGQDVLESGAAGVFAASDGWLNRALTLMPGGRDHAGLAIAPTVPLILRGAAPVSSWSPSAAPDASDDTIIRLMDLYGADPLLGPALAAAIETEALVGEAGMPMGAERRARRYGPNQFAPLAQAAARLMSAPDGPAAVVLGFDGWDTHINQGASQGQLAQRLAGLDAALRAFKTGLGAQWAQTLVLVTTEFGRTAAENGAGGTDHGTGGVAFVLGGSVAGGRFLGDWPGLSRAALHEGRDLAPVNDLRGLFAAALQAQWGLDRADIRRAVFSDGPAPPPFPALLRA